MNRRFWNKNFVADSSIARSSRSSLHVRVASFSYSHRAGISDRLKNRRVIPSSDVKSGCH